MIQACCAGSGLGLRFGKRTTQKIKTLGLLSNPGRRYHHRGVLTVLAGLGLGLWLGAVDHSGR
jgi:hypothetical protein